MCVCCGIRSTKAAVLHTNFKQIQCNTKIRIYCEACGMHISGVCVCVETIALQTRTIKPFTGLQLPHVSAGLTPPPLLLPPPPPPSSSRMGEQEDQDASLASLFSPEQPTKNSNKKDKKNKKANRRKGDSKGKVRVFVHDVCLHYLLEGNVLSNYCVIDPSHF